MTLFQNYYPLKKYQTVNVPFQKVLFFQKATEKQFYKFFKKDANKLHKTKFLCLTGMKRKFSFSVMLPINVIFALKRSSSSSISTETRAWCPYNTLNVLHLD